MSILQGLGFILFAVLLYKCVQPVPAKWRKLQRKEPGALADVVFSAVACGFCLWGLIAIFYFPH